MTPLSFYALILALFWGVIYALWLQRSKHGRFLAARYTWLSVVVGAGVDLLLARLVVNGSEWLLLVGLFVLSGIPIIIRSLVNEQRDQQELLHHGAKNKNRQ